jgi:hypothetical protein
MTGKWIGKYWFSGNVPDAIKDQETDFELIIDNYTDSKISGTISDIIETGGTAGIGSFSGTLKGGEIKFIKKMPINTSISQGGRRIEENKPHRPIYYRGILNSETGLITGTWKFKIGIGFVQGRLAIYLGSRGKWEMKKA